MATRPPAPSRSAAERAAVTHEWLRACEELHEALITPMGLPPRQWAVKVSLARKVDRLYANLIDSWRLFEASAVTDAASRDT
ncbi:MAG: hypothetical protein M3Z29_12885 [Pseudomonadota bacterium]|nr:hypothetical protein [Pseudomonadota bacterium]